MKVYLKTICAGLVALGLSACAEEGIPILKKVATKPLPDGAVTIDGETYVIKRATALEGRKKGEEVWAIMYQGKAYSCSSPNEISCEFALSRAKRGQREDRDMGY